MFVLGESVSKSIVFKDNKPVCVKDVFIKGVTKLLKKLKIYKKVFKNK